MGIQTYSTVKPIEMASIAPVRSRLLQRCTANEECEDCSKKRLSLQRASTTQTAPSSVPPIVHDVLRSPGQPLDASMRAFMEPRFGHNFSQVRVHTDARAAESARAVNALAYTVGRDVVFAADRYAPETNVGRSLLAHELTHVIQQRRSEGISVRPFQIVQSNDPSEHEADAVAAQVAGGGSFLGAQQNVLFSRPSAVIQRQVAQPQRTGDCSGWESDPQSFSKVIADHYVRTQLNRTPTMARTIDCVSNNRLCFVNYEDGTNVAVSFVNVPDHVIARERATGIRCEYDYDCTPGGRVILTRRSCRPS